MNPTKHCLLTGCDIVIFSIFNAQNVFISKPIFHCAGLRHITKALPNYSGIQGCQIHVKTIPSIFKTSSITFNNVFKITGLYSCICIPANHCLVFADNWKQNYRDCLNILKSFILNISLSFSFQLSVKKNIEWQYHNRLEGNWCLVGFIWRGRQSHPHLRWQIFFH